MYPPFFAIFFYPFSSAAAGPAIGVFLWTALNAAVFAAGFFTLLRTFDTDGVLDGRHYLLALVLVSNELLGAALAGQANALTAGLMMLGVSWYAAGRPAASAAALALAFSLKLMPLPLILLLALGLQPAFIAATVAFTALFSLFPALFTGLGPLASLWTHLAAIFLSDPVHPNYMGLQPLLAWLGATVDGKLFGGFALVNALAAAGVVWRRRAGKKEMAMAAYLLAMGFIIVFNKRTEGLTFVLLSPLFAVMLGDALAARARGRHAEKQVHLAALTTGWAAISYFSSDLCPAFIREQAYDWHIKGFGGLVVYAWVWWRLLAKSYPLYRE